MNTISKLVGGVFAAMCLAAGGAVALTTFGTFAQFMPPLPWAIGIALLLVAVLVGVRSRQFLGIGMVTLWAFGVGFAIWSGQSILDDGPISIHNLHAVIPWTFVACCAFAIVLNMA